MINNKREQSVALVVDYGPKIGAGHISRCRGLVEYITQCTKFPLTCFLPQYDGEIEWINSLESARLLSIRKSSFPKHREFSILLCDSYQEIVWRRFRESSIRYKVPIIDQGNKIEIQTPQAGMIVLESFAKVKYTRTNFGKTKEISHNSEFNGLMGTLIWNEKLRNLSSSKFHNKTKEGKVVISLSASDSADNALYQVIRALLKSRTENDSLEIIAYARASTRDEILKRVGHIPRLTIKEFSEDFYAQMQTCSLLISGSGTTAIEAFHLGVPAVIIELFANASANFVNLKEVYKNALFIRGKKLIDEEYLILQFKRALKELKQSPFRGEGIIRTEDLKKYFESLA